MELYNPSTIRMIKARYGFKFSKSLGQNFITEKSVIDGIVEGAMLTKEDLVIEIGPGIGVLTAGACEAAGKVVSVELDPNLIQVLTDTLAQYDNVKIVHNDILKTDLPALIAEEKGDLRHVKIIGNLPYYITTPILMKLLQSGVPAESITVMMQKEVADRICAGAGTKAYGALSVAVQYYCAVTKVEDVPKEVFMPQPKVDSTVIRLDLRDEPAVLVQDEKIFFRTVKAGFSQRRKTLLNSLQSAGLSKAAVQACLLKADIDPKRRAETLSLEEMARLADQIAEMEKKESH
ncbi:16S rRNA (adenine(1518)-N(6)/adenine(1519)-N(6))-dimethyltransferase RsmA [Eubacterium pyruvativorans]|uniref:16S rRNA (adenine(1518)-N(6)/adenine(1519)-N(6))- dimethyltransferase RsmA n=1 Tax=Eubacterium pyruvativorans TaxID=155865 RepID=UPI00156944E7|nr:16S rRNA (adenine(1518)-N(6)/adenine(1519)-N(6))-dimethyltransferase RsmA [Eubacterium pyruvativorans]MDD6707311.1 16S rRNA (adenine(1518)-N(6)/adenine(1519)-N(6))-dimethyltransferase RsmA [Eubacterium pyruvativorans]MDD7685055.1 16S rRNA (adenine(1518)-N(6)/adenine(1519)-N(6))-dimethyltransferase RsmA [Eubacterium pyruvativorans]